ncbi:MAG: probable methyltransferase, FkbM family protein [Leptospirillum rubarum]|nr:MAG: probable methyltransferase, FkbM family protein [Leptospirillum rubarum]
MTEPNQAKNYTINGIMLSIPEFIMSPKLHDDLISGTYESRELAPIRANIRPYDVVLELGAGIGFISTVVAKLFDNVHVVSYEANSLMLPIALNNHKINGVNVDLRHGLVTGKAVPEKVEFYEL